MRAAKECREEREVQIEEREEDAATRERKV